MPEDEGGAIHPLASALASLRITAKSGETLFRQPEGFFFGVDEAFGLGFGDGFQELADEGAGVQFQATHQFFGR